MLDISLSGHLWNPAVLCSPTVSRLGKGCWYELEGYFSSERMHCRKCNSLAQKLNPFCQGEIPDISLCCEGCIFESPSAFHWLLTIHTIPGQPCALVNQTRVWSKIYNIEVPLGAKHRVSLDAKTMGGQICPFMKGWRAGGGARWNTSA